MLILSSASIAAKQSVRSSGRFATVSDHSPAGHIAGAGFAGMPERAKGGSLFSGSRSEYSRAIIAEQVEEIAAKFVRGRVDFDGDNADWMIFPAFRLPRIWRRFAAPLMIVFPRDYPTTPPIGFYMPNWLDSPNGHFYETAYHGASEAPTLAGWNWYCCTVNDGCWRPYPARFRGEWRFGDNLWTYITLVNEVLGSPEDAD